MTEGKRQIIQQLLQEYDIETAEDIQDALKDLLGGTIKEMMEAEMDDHLGYEKSERSDSDDYRNGYLPDYSLTYIFDDLTGKSRLLQHPIFERECAAAASLNMS